MQDSKEEKRLADIINQKGSSYGKKRELASYLTSIGMPSRHPEEELVEMIDYLTEDISDGFYQTPHKKSESGLYIRYHLLD